MNENQRRRKQRRAEFVATAAALGLTPAELRERREQERIERHAAEVRGARERLAGGAFDLGDLVMVRHDDALTHMRAAFTRRILYGSGP